MGKGSTFQQRWKNPSEVTVDTAVDLMSLLGTLLNGFMFKQRFLIGFCVEEDVGMVLSSLKVYTMQKK